MGIVFQKLRGGSIKDSYRDAEGQSSRENRIKGSPLLCISDSLHRFLSG
jgi:hypothetical protein